MADPNDLQTGIQAAQAGDWATARARLTLAVRANPRSEAAWWWLAQSLEEPERQAYCIQRVLALNPEHPQAQQWRQEHATPPAPTEPPPAPAVSASRPAQPKPPAPPLPTPNPANPPLARLALAERAPAAPSEPEGNEPLPTPAPAVPVSPSNSGVKPAVPPKRGLSGLQLALLAGGGLVLALCLVVPIGLWATGSLPGFNATPVPTVVVAVSTPVSFPTLPPEWTVTPTQPTPTPSLTPVRAEPLSDRLVQREAEISNARNLALTGDYAAAILAWNDILAEVPDYADGYFQRAAAYYELNRNQRVLQEYVAYSEQMLIDTNQAISLDPTVGDYYLYQYYALDGLKYSVLYNVDKDVYRRMALEAIRRANELGNRDPLGERQPGFLLVELGECETAEAEFQHLMDISAEPSAGLNTGLALALACQGRYPEALTAIDLALTIFPSVERVQTRAEILYHLGRLDEALAMMDESLETQPYYCGCRYYLRALVRYEFGQPEQARDDIILGSGNTWVRGGLRSYVLGHLALDEGQTEEGIFYLQEALVSLPSEHHGLAAVITSELAALGAEPLDLSDGVPPTPTLLPMNLQAQAQPATSTPIPYSQPEGFEGAINNYTGTGPLTLAPGESLAYHYQPPTPVTLARAETMIIYVSGAGESFTDSGLALWTWHPVVNQWATVGLYWDYTTLSDGAQFITASGELFVVLENNSAAAVSIDNFSIAITGVDEGGHSISYGP